MRRIAGAWLLFCLIALPGFLDTATRLVTASRTGKATTAYRQDMPRANELPTGKSPSVSKELPPRFLQQPLVFFSTAPPESLALLPGIGPVLAARVCDARGGKRLFNSWDDLLGVKGIGDKTVTRLKRLAESQRPIPDSHGSATSPPDQAP